MKNDDAGHRQRLADIGVPGPEARVETVTAPWLTGRRKSATAEPAGRDTGRRRTSFQTSACERREDP